MSSSIPIDLIWWRNIPVGEFYNTERYHRITGGGGSLYFEIPNSMVPDTLLFLNLPSDGYLDLLPVEIEAKVIGKPSISGKLTFESKSGGRLRIARQNRQQPSSQRHPAWTSAYGYPKAPDDVANREEARLFFPEGGLRIFIVRTLDGEYYAGFTKGHRPPDMDETSPYWDLYREGNVPGGLIRG